MVKTARHKIDMTLTTMGCPLADLLTDQIHDAMSDVPEEQNGSEIGVVSYLTVDK